MPFSRSLIAVGASPDHPDPGAALPARTIVQGYAPGADDSSTGWRRPGVRDRVIRSVVAARSAHRSLTQEDHDVRLLPGTRLGWHAVMISGVLAMITACAASPATSNSATPLVTSTPSQAATAAATAPPSASPIQAATPSPGCSISTDVVPETGKVFYLSGAGFAPDVDIEITFVGPDGTDTFGGPDFEIKVPALHTASDGAFGPWDIRYEDTDGVGDFQIQASDGDCRASLSFTLD